MRSAEPRDLLFRYKNLFYPFSFARMRHKTKFTTRTRIVGGRIFGSLMLKMARLIASPVLFIADLTLAIKLCQSYVKSSWNATCERLYERKKLEEVRLLREKSWMPQMGYS
jgi:hypothetical protein